MKNIVVVGSLNMDLVLEVNRVPKIGETIKGEEMSYLVGGKGANEAVAASRLGNEVKMLKHVKEEDDNVEGVIKDEAIFSGIATIFKTTNDNSIVVIPGANDFCNKDLIDKNLDIIKSADILITQLEIPLETVEYVLKVSKENDVKTILNPAPATKINKELLKNVDFITPNETEFEIISQKVFNHSNELEEAIV